METTPTEPKPYPHEILTRKELAARLKMSLRGIDLLQSKGLPHFKLGKPSRFIFEDVLEWLKAGNAQDLRHTLK